MQRVQCLGYIRFVHGQRGFQQLVRLFDELYQFGAVAGLDHLQQFGAHFLVGDAQRLMVEVVVKVAVVREQGKQFIAAFQCVPVVAVVEHRHLFLVVYQQVFDGLFHSVEVHVDVVADRLEGGGLRPVIVEAVLSEGEHDGGGVEYVSCRSHVVAVVPFLHFGIRHSVGSAERSYLIGGKPVVAAYGVGVDHGVWLEIVQRRLRAVLLDGQDAGHVDRCKDAVCVSRLEQAAQQPYVVFHQLGLVCQFAAECVPFVDN